MTSEGDLRRPGVPASCPLAGPDAAPPPPDAAQHRAVAPLTSPAKRTGSTLGPLGFYLPLYFFIPPPFCSLCLLRPCRQVGQVPSADHERTRPFDIPKRAPGGVVPIQVVGFHILRWPLKRHVEARSWQRAGGAMALATFEASQQRSLHT